MDTTFSASYSFPPQAFIDQFTMKLSGGKYDKQG